jgi:hypothetical protein
MVFMACGIPLPLTTVGRLVAAAAAVETAVGFAVPAGLTRDDGLARAVGRRVVD